MPGSDADRGKTSPPHGSTVWPKTAFLERLEALRADYRVMGPMGEGGHTAFRQIEQAADLALDYQSTMIPPGKAALFTSRQELVRFETGESVTARDIPAIAEAVLLVGVHPCDLNAILYLDRTMLADPHYQTRRANTVLVGLNCTRVSPFCFCSSVGTGPHLDNIPACDVLLTDLGKEYLLEFGSQRGADLFPGGESSTPEKYQQQEEQRQHTLARFSKHLDIRDLDRLLLANPEHPVWKRVAEARCLSCTNCVMVCPTCFCHDVADEKDMDLKTTTRVRQWDSCQDRKFAAVAGGNFRGNRAARLRQFVMHKLSYTAQYGVMGTVGCGRCIQWCPTMIDLTQIAQEIQRSSDAEPVPAR